MRGRAGEWMRQGCWVLLNINIDFLLVGPGNIPQSAEDEDRDIQYEKKQRQKFFFA